MYGAHDVLPPSGSTTFWLASQVAHEPPLHV
jgi:hypothetical protein